MAIEQDRPPLIPSPEELRILKMDETHEQRREKFKDVLSSDKNKTWYYQSEIPGQPKISFRAQDIQRGFDRAELSIRLAQLDLGWDLGYSEAWSRLMDGTLPEPPKATDPSQCPEHLVTMFTRSRLHFLCPVDGRVFYTKPL